MKSIGIDGCFFADHVALARPALGLQPAGPSIAFRAGIAGKRPRNFAGERLVLMA